MKFQLKKFKDLNLDELYKILRLRAEIFVVEQECAYQDLDNKDQRAYHLMAIKGGELVGYTRILNIGISYQHFSSIGRVVIRKKYRKEGLGYQLMEESIRHCQMLFPNTNIKISAQFHLKTFYNNLGFVETGDQYLEDDIPHIAMIYSNKNTN